MFQSPVWCIEKLILHRTRSEGLGAIFWSWINHVLCTLESSVLRWPWNNYNIKFRVQTSQMIAIVALFSKWLQIYIMYIVSPFASVFHSNVKLLGNSWELCLDWLTPISIWLYSSRSVELEILMALKHLNALYKWSLYAKTELWDYGHELHLHLPEENGSSCPVKNENDMVEIISKRI